MPGFYYQAVHDAVRTLGVERYVLRDSFALQGDDRLSRRGQDYTLANSCLCRKRQLVTDVDGQVVVYLGHIGHQVDYQAILCGNLKVVSDTFLRDGVPSTLTRKGEFAPLLQDNLRDADCLLGGVVYGESIRVGRASADDCVKSYGVRAEGQAIGWVYRIFFILHTGNEGGQQQEREEEQNFTHRRRKVDEVSNGNQGQLL